MNKPARVGLTGARRAFARHCGDRGTALITALIMLTVLGLFLFGFETISKNELLFAGYSRNSTIAFDAAEAGLQEALARLKMFGYTAGATPASFTNSFTAHMAGASGTVTFLAALQSNSAVLPVLSTATVNGVQRRVRLLVNAAPNFWDYQIFGNGVNFDGNTTPTTGNDIYSTADVEMESYPNSPLCAAGATALNLISPQVLGGAIVYGESPGSSVTPPCGGPTNAGTYFAECQDLQTYFQPIQTGGSPSGALPTGSSGRPAIGEVAPTTSHEDGGRATSNTAGGMSPQALGSSYSAPVNWHPMTPIAMSSADFTNIVKAWNQGTLPSGVTVVQASQTNAGGTQTGVTYSPLSYTPSYWSSVSSTNTKVMLIASTQPFCVNTITGAVTLAAGNPCASGSNYYGYNGSINGSSGGSSDDTGTFPIRYFDWSLITDDLNRGIPQTFFGPGNQNGIRYIPQYPIMNVVSYACKQNMNPGTNVFDNVNHAGVTCSNPPTQTINSTSVTFSGTKGAPESLVISNNTGGSQIVTITGSVSGQSSGTSCTGLNPGFDQGNWGVILASGDVKINGNFVFTGYMYVQGNITMASSSQHVWLNGGLITQQTSTPANAGILDLNNKSSFIGLCGGTPPQLGTPMFTTYSPMSWQDVPAGKP
ncbi:MAG: pilus assembly PilX family protein [bacterium]